MEDDKYKRSKYIVENLDDHENIFHFEGENEG
jgi:hypothetical protein